MNGTHRSQIGHLGLCCSEFPPVNGTNCSQFGILGLRGSKFIPVYNFPAHPSFGNQHNLNFEVMAVRDIMRRSLLSKNIHLSREFWPFWEFKYQEKCFCKYFLVRFR